MQHLKVLAGALLLSVGLVGAAHAACDPSKSGMGGTVIYEGQIGGKLPVRVALIFVSGGAVQGLSASTDGSADTPVSGQVSEGGKHLRLTERDAAGKTLGAFDGAFADHDAHYSGGLNCEVINGAWTQVAGGPSLPLTLNESSSGNGSPDHLYGPAGVADDAVIDRAAAAFRTAVLARRRAVVAAAVRYPVTVTIGKKPVKLRNAKALVANYDKVFTPKFRAMIKVDTPRLMFARDQGVMLGGGEIWFDDKGRVIAINN
jgi:hypothetical protein